MDEASEGLINKRVLGRCLQSGVVWRRDLHQGRQAVDVLRRRSGFVRSQDRRLVVLDDF